MYRSDGEFSNIFNKLSIFPRINRSVINYQYFQEVIKYYQGYHVKLSLHLIGILLIMSTSKEAIISKLRPQMKEFIETIKKKLYVPSVPCSNIYQLFL